MYIKCFSERFFTFWYIFPLLNAVIYYLEEDSLTKWKWKYENNVGRRVSDFPVLNTLWSICNMQKSNTTRFSSSKAFSAAEF